MTQMSPTRHARRVRRSIMARLPACPVCSDNELVGFDPDADLYCFREGCTAKLPVPQNRSM